MVLRFVLIGLAVATMLPSRAQELRVEGSISSVSKMLDRPMQYSYARPATFEREITWESMLRNREYQKQVEMNNVAQKSVKPVKSYFQRPRQRVTFKLDFGNSAVKNWSPYPDRALDARVIRYPMPRSAAYGKAPRK